MSLRIRRRRRSRKFSSTLVKAVENKKLLIKLQIIGLIIWYGCMPLALLNPSSGDTLFIKITIPTFGLILFLFSFAIWLKFNKTRKEQWLSGLVLIILIIIGFVLQFNFIIVIFPFILCLMATLAALKPSSNSNIAGGGGGGSGGCGSCGGCGGCGGGG